MQKVVDVSLSGHAEPYRLHEDAYDALRRYLERAGARLRDDPDRAEVIGDLERSIGERLTNLVRSGTGVIDAVAINAILEEVGAVDTEGGEPVAAPVDRPRARRRLYRIREGQEWAGVCTGLAAYAELEVNVVRWVFVGLGLVTVGLFLLVYVVAMFVLPVVATREEYLAVQPARDEGS